MRWFTVLLFSILLSVSLAQAAPVTSTVSSEVEETAITIYTDNLAIITERRFVDVPKGRSRISFEGVSSMMIPQTAVLQSFTGFTLERNFDFDLITPGALYDAATGDTVTLVRTDRATGQTKVVEANVVSGGNGVILEIDGKYEAFDCAGLPEKIAFDDIPSGLNPRPVLSVEVEAAEAGRKELVLSYLASGFGWEADYRLDVDKTENAGKLVGWLTVRNDTEVSIEEAKMSVIAGDLQRLRETNVKSGNAKGFSARCWPRGSSKTGVRYQPPPMPSENDGIMMKERAFSPMMSMAMEDETIVVTGSRITRAELEEFGDYKLYRVPEPTTVAAYQDKQVLFLSKPEVELKKIHTFNFYWPGEGAGQVLPARVVYHLDNSREGKLAQPLPEGTIRVMTKSATDKLFFLGEDEVENLAVDLPAEFDIASAADILIETRVLSERTIRLGKENYQERHKVEHTFFNASPEEALVEFKVAEEAYSPVTVLNASLPLDTSKDTPVWRFKLAPESSQTLTYEARWQK